MPPILFPINLVTGGIQSENAESMGATDPAGENAP
jgi:hypothetical protein